jgi:hypothetical protein
MGSLLVQENYQEEKACDKINNNNAVNRPLYIKFTHRKKNVHIKAHLSLKSKYLFLKNSGYHERGVSFKDTVSY